LFLQSEEAGLVQQASFTKNDSSLVLLQMKVSGEGPSGVIRQSDHQRVGNRRFPMDREIQVQTATEQFYFRLQFNNVEFEKNLDFPFSVPRNYKRK
ncbi:MAG: DUF4292 domain-containing protein, partial [Sphingobacteriales bacterium]